MNSRNKGEHKVKEGHIGVHNADLIDWLKQEWWNKQTKKIISVMSTGSDH